MLVVQDDINDGGNQNFKLVRWEHVVRELDALGTLRGSRLAAGSVHEDHGDLVEQ